MAKQQTVDSNFFLGESKDRSGGIRVVDSEHLIVNNYIADIDDRADAAISLVAGINGGPASMACRQVAISLSKTF